MTNETNPGTVDELRDLIAKATDEDLCDGGRYFSEHYRDLTKCGHGDTGEYQHSEDGELVEWLWNRRHAILAVLAALPHKEEATPVPVGERIEVQIDDNPAGLPRAFDPEPEEWDGPLTAEEQAKIDAAWEKHKAADPVCRIPPEGWSCSRVAGHDGPCAATPATTERGRG